MKKALIIAHVSGFLTKFCKEDVRILKELGYEVHYASNRNEKGYYFDEQELEKMGVIFHHIEIERSPYMIKNNFRALRYVLEIIKREKIQLIHCHTPVGGMIGRLAGWLSIKERPKVIYTAHGFHFFKGAPLLNNTAFYLVEKLLAPMTDVLIVINREDYENACKFRLKKGGRVYRIPGVGVDRDAFQPVAEEEKTKLREQKGIPEDTFLVLSVGELNQNKNHEVVLKAMKKIQNEKKPGYEKIRYVICGDGFYREQMKEYIKRIGVEHCASLLGYQCGIQNYYAMSDVTVFPSVREGLGMAGIESLSMGIPVIAADNRGTREYMKDGNNGIVCSCMDVNAFAEAIFKIKNLSAEKKAQLKQYCRESVEKFDQKYTYQIMNNIYTVIDREILDEAAVN